MKKNLTNEATGAGGIGNFRVPLNLAPQIWQKEPLEPFRIPVSQYISPNNAYDSYDGNMERTPQEIKKLEKLAKKMAIQAKKMFSQNDQDGNPFNGYIPQGSKESGTPEYIKRQANIPSSEYENVLVKEDLAVWFGTKKKPKGSKQPKGPWVNICRKKEGGGHPPCGRPEATDKGYPKCRAAGVASKMTDAQKKAACAQKRRAEKSNPKSGTGNKPKMTSYKPKSKKNESIRDIIKQVLRETFNK